MLNLSLSLPLLGVFLFGLMVGSFLNVCIYRIPLGQSVVVPRSHCPNCGRFIRWFDNIPVLSWLLLRGRCRSCDKSISIQYPIVETVTGLISLAVFMRFEGWIAYLCLFLLLAAPLVAMTVIDLQHRILPNLLTLPGIASGIALSLLGPPGLPISGGTWPDRLLASLIGAGAGGGTLFLVSWLYEKIRGREGIGMGDVKLALMIGAFFGWKGVFLTLFLSSFLGSVVGLCLILFFRRGLKSEIPYGPFLAAAAMTVLFFGETLISTYLRWTGHLP